MVTATCIHHWIVDSPDPIEGSLFFPAKCRKCGETRDFPASPDEEDAKSMHKKFIANAVGHGEMATTVLDPRGSRYI